MTKKILLFILLFCSGTVIHAQKTGDGYFILLDNDMNQVTDAKKATMFLNIRKLSDSAWRYDYYLAVGPRLRTETFKDEDGTLPNGRFVWYNALGFIDSCGDAKNGRRDGKWYYFVPFKTDFDRVVTYNNGKFVNEVICTEESRKQDENEADYVESSFKGSFKKFLEKNLVFPDRAQNAQMGSAVIVFFELDSTGAVLDPMLLRSVEYSLDHEAERVILKSSGNWNPGYKNGTPVSTYHQQSINFSLQ